MSKQSIIYFLAIVFVLTFFQPIQPAFASFTFTLEELKSDPKFLELSPDKQKNLEIRYTEETWKITKSGNDYVFGSSTEREAIRTAFEAKYPFGVRFTKSDREEDGEIEKQIFIEKLVYIGGIVGTIILIAFLLFAVIRAYKKGKLLRLKKWYFNINNKQRVIIWIILLSVCAIPFFGWFFIAPWLIPALIYMEYCR